MNFRRILSVLLLASMLSCQVFAAPVVAGVADSASESGFDSNGSLFSEDGIVLDIGTKQTSSNVRYVEIDGVQSLVEGNDSTYTLTPGDNNMLVEFTEKANEDTAVVVKTQYFYVDVVNETVEKLNIMDTHMQSYDEKSIRTVGETGLRFKAYAATNAKYEKEQFVIDEYGYLIATKASLGDKDLTLESDKYVKGIGFSREQGINIVFDATNDDYDVFTLVLKNIPTEHFDAEIVCKTYTKLTVHGESFVVYGEKMCGSAYEVAKEAFAADYTDIGIAGMLFDYYSYAGADENLFDGAIITSDVISGTCSISGSFTNVSSSAAKYNVYLATYNEYGTMLSVIKSSSYTLKKGINNLEITMALSDSVKQTKAFVFTSAMEFAGCEEKGNWQITEKSFYDSLASASFSADNGYFNPDSNVTAIEAITLLSQIHALHNKKDINDVADDYSYTIEFDDADMIVDLTDRNSRNDDKINFKKATGGIDEDAGYLYGQTNIAEGKDPQVVINGLNLDARHYNKMTIRLKLENLPGDTTTSVINDTVQIFFKTNYLAALSESRSIYRRISRADIEKGWFEYEFDMSARDDWRDVITGIRVDPSNQNIKFYIDYITFTKSSSTQNDTWYDKYLDYAHENNIIEVGQYNWNNFTSEVSRKDVIFMFLDSFEEDDFKPINNVTAIPDITKNEKYVDFYLMMYNSGIMLGFDEDGNLGLKSPITRSQLAAMANRMLVPENRIKGTVNASWEGGDYKHDIEFSSPSDLDWFNDIRKIDNMVVADGCFSFRAHTWDSYLIAENNVSINADLYTKIKVRMKAEFNTTPTSNSDRTVSVYFRTPKYDGNPENFVASATITDNYLDEFGWYVFELDMTSVPNWDGEVTYFRFDPMNATGNYKIDYIRFIKSPYADLPTQADLIAAGYTSKKLMPDGFKNGFYVESVDQSVKWDGLQERKWVFAESDSDVEPMWTIGPWWQGTGEGFTEIDLWETKILSNGGYTIADSFGANTITYNPELDSITQRLDATKIYNGKPHPADDPATDENESLAYKWWPHQLLDTNENFTVTVDKEYNSADADRIFVELDIRMLDFKPTTNTEGMNVCSYLAYFYLRPKIDDSQLIWFGLTLFSGANLNASSNIIPNWAPDSAAHQYMYGMPQAVVYDGIKNSFNPEKGVAAVGEEWKHIRLDVTPHIDKALEWANRDNAFGFEVEKKDMYFNGVNIGYEIHGNFDATFEIKNFNIIAYNKPESN